MNIDLTSLLAGVSLTAIGGWFACFLAFRKDERAVYIKQITEERTKWRVEMRKLTEEIVQIYSNENITPSTEKVAIFKARLHTSINPICDYDKAIFAEFGRLTHNGDCLEFTKRMSFLLKHDWERVKWECMPLYLKVVKRYTKKQKAWRSTTFRPLESESQQG